MVDRKKLFLQLAAMLLILVLFLAFDLGIYELVTVRCTGNFGRGKMIRTEDYLPFRDDSLIVKESSSLRIEGDLPVLDGATALLPVYSAFANALYPPDSCGWDGSSFTAGSTVQYTNTTGAWKAIADGTADIIFVAAPSREQAAYAEERGMQLEMIPIGREAFVFLVNADNPVDGLTQDQVKGIYAGRYRNWKERGGADRPINPLTRKTGSGSQSALLRFLGDEKVKKSFTGITGGSIGFSFRFYVEGIVENSRVKMLSLDGVYPSAESIRSGSYPLTSSFYAVCRADDPNPNVRKVIDWILSPEGQDIIERSGYVGLEQ